MNGHYQFKHGETDVPPAVDFLLVGVHLNHIKYMMEDYAVFVYLIEELPLENKSKESGAGDTEMTLADSFTKASGSMYD